MTITEGAGWFPREVLFEVKVLEWILGDCWGAENCVQV